jgi:signal transduction histidine kinase
VILLRTLAWVRVGLIPLALLQLLTELGDFPGRYETAAWLALAWHMLAAGVLLALTLRWRGRPRHLAMLTLGVDMVIAETLLLVYSWQGGQPLRALQYLIVLEGALLFRLRGGLLVAALIFPMLALGEWLRVEEFGADWQVGSLVVRTGIGGVLGGVVGRLVELERRQARRARERAAEAERLRDELGRRVDLLESANLCARALGSSLRLEEAFAAFVEELQRDLRFDRMMVLRVEEGATQVVATAGLGADEFPTGQSADELGAAVKSVMDGRTLVRADLQEDTRKEEEPLVALGLRSRVVAPLQAGGHVSGFFSLSRTEPNSFTPEEVEFASLIGRLLATSVQNIRAYEAERTTVEELRRLSALRADFVSLVSHELRSPMAAVIGSARTLEQRWRELRPEQREAFLAVIGDETSRLAGLIEDVLHTSRIEAGTFSYRFDDVDLAELVRQAVATASLAQDEVRLTAEVAPSLPPVRADAERLRQLVDNLVSNAVKYSEAGQEVRVTVGGDNGRIRVAVRDEGAGIAPEHHGLIFEKFGRTAVAGGRPGTGLGLFIARSIAEAHGGTLEVQSMPGHGSTFTLILPV